MPEAVYKIHLFASVLVGAVTFTYTLHSFFTSQFEAAVMILALGGACSLAFWWTASVAKTVDQAVD